MPTEISSLLTVFGTLTKPQQSIFMLVAEGLTNEQIADRLGITLYRAKSHRAIALKIMGVSSLVAIAGQAALLRPILHEKDDVPAMRGMEVASSSPLCQDDFFRILEIRDLPQLLSATNRLIKASGFDTFYFVAAAPADNGEQRLTCLGTYPERWTERYWKQSFNRIDPVALHCEQHHYPLAWTNNLFHGGAQCANFYEEARAFGISAGGTCPQTERNNKGIAGLSFSRDQDADMAQQDVLHALPSMHMLSSYIFETLQNILSATSPLSSCPSAEKPQLTAQEHECLLRAASGLNAGQIADKINLSRRTVYFHLANIRRKLRAANHSNMIAKAIVQGIIII